MILVSWENDEQRELGMPRAAKKSPKLKKVYLTMGSILIDLIGYIYIILYMYYIMDYGVLNTRDNYYKVVSNKSTTSIVGMA